MKTILAIAALLGAAPLAAQTLGSTTSGVTVGGRSSGAAAAARADRDSVLLASGEKVSRVVVYGRDPCPRSGGDEIVICARRPETERYRIPRNLREGVPLRDGESWAARSRSLEYVGRSGIQSCSTVGPGGFTGCWAEMMRQARESRTVNPEGQHVP
jgi:hypothetical protein